jgi:tetratricopeptide (TPR) repeat protein
MTRQMAKSTFVLFALGLWILACPASLAGDGNPKLLNQQVNQLIEQGKYQEAIPIAERALEMAKRARGPEQPETADALNNLGFLFQKTGDYAKAEPLYQEALRIAQKTPEHPYTAMVLNNLGELYRAMGEYAKAEPPYQEALRIRQKFLGPENPVTASSLNNLALLYQAMGEFAKAEPLFREVLRIRRKVLGPEHTDTAMSLNNLALLCQAMGEYIDAELFLQEALRIQQKVLGPEHAATAISLNNLAVLYQAMGEYTEAEPLLQEALRIFQKILGPENRHTAQSLNNLAVLYMHMYEYAKAEPLLQEALRVRQKVLGPQHPDTATGLDNLAALYQAMGEYAKAEPLFQDALEIRQKVLGPKHPDTVISLHNLAWLDFDLGRINEATDLARQASAAELTILSKIFAFTSEKQRLAYLDIFYPYSLFPFLKGTETDLAEAVLRYKGVVLDSIIEDRMLAEAGQGSEDKKSVEQINLDKSQLGQLLLQSPQEPSAGTNQRIEALEGDVQGIESQLAQHVAALGQARHALGVRLEQVQATIPKDGALIEYLRYWDYLGQNRSEWHYGAIVLSFKGPSLWIPLGKANDIEHLVQRYGTLVRGSPQEEELSSNLQSLYEALWAPIGQALPTQTKRIIISPDGELNFISFATLLTKDQQFLAQTYDVQYVASGRDLLREPKQLTAKDVVLFANPDFALASTSMLAKADNGSSDSASKSIGRGERGDIEDWSFGSLEGTQKERDELITKFTGWGSTPTAFTQEKATKGALLKIHSPYILHLATHGFFAKEDSTATQTPPESSLNNLQGVTKSKFFKNPMHRSGLALAGAQTTIDAWKRDEVPPVETMEFSRQKT